MPHPFFQTAVYPWSRRAEATELHLRLHQGYKKKDAIEQLYQSAGPNLTPLNLDQAPDLVWKEALDNLTRAGRLKELCDLVLADPNAGPVIGDAVLAVRNAPDPVAQTLLPNNLIFVDRQQFREKLQRLASGPSVPVLLVRGGADSGKSWSRHMVIEVAKTLGHPCVYLFEGLVATVDDVLDQLFTILDDPNGPPPRLETEDAWFKKICLRLHSAAKKSGQTCWLVIDDLGSDATGPRLDPLIRQFFDQFVLSMGNPAFAQWFRVVLIDYPDAAVPTKWLDVWEEDRPDVAHMNAEALSAFAREYAARANKNMDANEALDFATGVLSAVDAAANPAKPRLKSIHDELVARLAKL